MTQIAVERGSARQLTQNTVLVVDDDVDMRESLRDVLEAEGYRVLQASNGKVALGLLPTLPRPCGLVLDLTMPVMGGRELYQTMRGSPGLADIPVVFLTSDPSAGPTGLLMMQKTVSVERLLGAVAALF